MNYKPDSYKPIPGDELPRFAGIATFMRLPHVTPANADAVDIGLIGVPWDGGTTNRAGAGTYKTFTQALVDVNVRDTIAE